MSHFPPKFYVFQDLITGKVKDIGQEEEGLYILQLRKRQHDTIKESLTLKGSVDAGLGT